MSHTRAPFPYFGGKSRIADDVWEALGKVKSYIEPFCGSAAVMIANPHPSSLHLEIINDMDGLVTNAWRTMKYDPEGLKEYVDWPMSELDLHARSEWVEEQREDLERKLREEDLQDILSHDPHFYDTKIAGWWMWGLGCAIGDSFIEQKKSLPSILSPRGVLGKTFDVDEVFGYFEKRLEHTKICCGDWKRVSKENIITHHTPTGVFLDPPYSTEDRHDTYSHESYSVADEVEEWCREHEDREGIRIVLAGYEGDYNLPSWKCIPWETRGGYGNITRTEDGKTQGKENASKERLWLSPQCQTDLEDTIVGDFIDIDNE